MKSFGDSYSPGELSESFELIQEVDTHEGKADLYWDEASILYCVIDKEIIDSERAILAYLELSTQGEGVLAVNQFWELPGYDLLNTMVAVVSDKQNSSVVHKC